MIMMGNMDFWNDFEWIRTYFSLAPTTRKKEEISKDLRLRFPACYKLNFPKSLGA